MEECGTLRRLMDANVAAKSVGREDGSFEDDGVRNGVQTHLIDVYGPLYGETMSSINSHNLVGSPSELSLVRIVHMRVRRLIEAYFGDRLEVRARVRTECVRMCLLVCSCACVCVVCFKGACVRTECVLQLKVCMM